MASSACVARDHADPALVVRLAGRNAYVTALLAGAQSTALDQHIALLGRACYGLAPILIVVREIASRLAGVLERRTDERRTPCLLCRVEIMAAGAQVASQVRRVGLRRFSGLGIASATARLTSPP